MASGREVLLAEPTRDPVGQRELDIAGKPPVKRSKARAVSGRMLPRPVSERTEVEWTELEDFAVRESEPAAVESRRPTRLESSIKRASASSIASPLGASRSASGTTRSVGRSCASSARTACASRASVSIGSVEPVARATSDPMLSVSRGACSTTRARSWARHMNSRSSRVVPTPGRPFTMSTRGPRAPPRFDPKIREARELAVPSDEPASLAEMSAG